jgi:glycopeptide antibiotics resistance protein
MCNECHVLTVVGFILYSVCFVFVCLLSLCLCVAAESYIELEDKEFCELTGWNYGF